MRKIKIVVENFDNLTRYVYGFTLGQMSFVTVMFFEERSLHFTLTCILFSLWMIIMISKYDKEPLRKSIVNKSNKQIQSHYIVDKNFFQQLLDRVIERIEDNKDYPMSEKSIELRANKAIMDYLKENFEPIENQ